MIANEESKSVVLMDTPDTVSAMEAFIRQVDIQTVTLEIQLKFGRASEVLDSVRPLLTQSVGTISADMTANTITVTDTPSIADKVRRLAETLDSRGRKIILEAKLVHIVLDDEHLSGVDWSGIVADHQNFRIEGKYGFSGGKDKDPLISLGTIDGSDFVPLIEALDTVGIVKEYPVVDVPLMSDNAVRMVVHFNEPNVVLGLVEPDAPQDLLSADDAVIEFVLKPQVDADSMIRTVITAGESRKEAARSPMLARKPRSIAVRSLEGGTIVLGGLIATEQVLTRRKIPLMGDLPLFGFAFRYHNSSVQREEFVILLTPRIITPEALGQGAEVPVSGK